MINYKETPSKKTLSLMGDRTKTGIIQTPRKEPIHKLTVHMPQGNELLSLTPNVMLAPQK
jgi:hypothetical protein